LKEVSRDQAHFAIVRSESDAHGQAELEGIHADATREGFTRAMIRTQYLVVVLPEVSMGSMPCAMAHWHYARTMSIIDEQRHELREDKTAATNFLRATFNGQPVGRIRQLQLTSYERVGATFNGQPGQVIADEDSSRSGDVTVCQWDWRSGGFWCMKSLRRVDFPISRCMPLMRQ
jgi:hypothetical protein